MTFKVIHAPVTSLSKRGCSYTGVPGAAMAHFHLCATQSTIAKGSFTPDPAPRGAVRCRAAPDSV